MQVTIRELLDKAGLTITTPESDTRSYGYIWRDRLWVGPFRGEYQALQAAFN